MNKKTTFIDLLKNDYTQKFIAFSSLLSYFISNLLIFFTFSTFFEFTSIKNLPVIVIKGIYFMIGTFISFILIKTNYFIIASTKKEKQAKISVIKAGSVKFNIGKWNTFIIFLRLLFFNIMNDLFIVLIIWSSLFSFGYVASIINLIPDSFSTLVSLLSMVGILSGIFQFYIQTYKEKISKLIINALIKYLRKIYKKYSFNDFLNFTKKKNNALFKDIDDKLKTNPSYPIIKVFRDLRSGKGVTNVTLNISAGDDVLLAQSLEYSDIDKEKLIDAYDLYFKSKNEEIKKEIDKFNFSEIRKVLFPNIMFFDEAMAQIISSNYDFEKIEDPESYTEFLAKYTQENVLYLIEKLFEGKNAKN